MFPLDVSVRPEYFRFLEASVFGFTTSKMAGCARSCMIGVADMEIVFGALSSSSSESVDMETSDAESSL